MTVPCASSCAYVFGLHQSFEEAVVMNSIPNIISVVILVVSPRYFLLSIDTIGVVLPTRFGLHCATIIRM